MQIEALTTERLLLRRWQESDLKLLAQMNSDPRVMELFPAMLSQQESREMFERIQAHFERHGFGFWVAEIPGVTPFAGFVGLAIPRFESHFTPCVEIGWRILPEFWNRGYATEAARAALDFGFTKLQLEEIVAFTVPANLPSRRVMEKIGMSRDPADDFDHPTIGDGHPLKRLVLYRIPRR